MSFTCCHYVKLRLQPRAQIQQTVPGHGAVQAGTAQRLRPLLRPLTRTTLTGSGSERTPAVSAGEHGL